MYQVFEARGLCLVLHLLLLGPRRRRISLTPPRGAWESGRLPRGEAVHGTSPRKDRRVVTNTQATEGWQPPSSAMLCPEDGGVAPPSSAHWATHFTPDGYHAQLRERQREPVPLGTCRLVPKLWISRHKLLGSTPCEAKL